MPVFQDLVGSVFNNWTVLSRQPNVITDGGSVTTYLCRCICGEERNVRAGHLKNNASKSCGCSHGGRIKHGGAAGGKFTKKYATWRYIRERCLNPNNKDADIYNGLLCERWMDFTAFNLDVPAPENDNLTIERIDNTKGYEPGNVTWVTMAQQHRNQTNNRHIEFNGKIQLLSDWAMELNISVSGLHQRLSIYSIEVALSKPLGERTPPAHNKLFITKDGITDSVEGWAGRLNVSTSTIHKRRKNGTF